MVSAGAQGMLIVFSQDVLQIFAEEYLTDLVYSWYYTFSLCLIRIIGAVCQLLTLTDHSVGLLEAVLVFNHIGLSSLLLATLGMLSRMCVTWERN